MSGFLQLKFDNPKSNLDELIMETPGGPEDKFEGFGAVLNSSDKLVQPYLNTQLSILSKPESESNIDIEKSFNPTPPDEQTEIQDSLNKQLGISFSQTLPSNQLKDSIFEID